MFLRAAFILKKTGTTSVLALKGGSFGVLLWVFLGGCSSLIKLLALSQVLAGELGVL